MVNAVILLALAVLVFVPIRYVYPSRSTRAQVADARAGLDLGSADVRDDVAVSGDLEAGAVRLAAVPGLLLRPVAGVAFETTKFTKGHEDKEDLVIRFLLFVLFVSIVVKDPRGVRL